MFKFENIQMQLHQSVLFISVALMLLVLCIFIYVAKNSSDQREYAPIQKKGYKFRAGLFWILAVLGVVVGAATLKQLPYEGHASSTAQTTIDVVGHQWYWEVSENEVIAGTPVLFNITSADVNHGLGIYNEDFKLIAQSQAMPGYTNRLEHTFETPGVYNFLCLEFCGSAHHVMVYEINVVAKEK